MPVIVPRMAITASSGPRTRRSKALVATKAAAVATDALSSNRQTSEPSTSTDEPAPSAAPDRGTGAVRASRGRAWGRTAAVVKAANSASPGSVAAPAAAAVTGNFHVEGMGAVKLLTADEEKMLMGRVQTFLKLDRRFEAFRAAAVAAGGREPGLAEFAATFGGRVDASQMEELFSEGHHCKQAMVEANFRLVVSIARNYDNKGLEMKVGVKGGMACR